MTTKRTVTKVLLTVIVVVIAFALMLTPTGLLILAGEDSGIASLVGVVISIPVGYATYGVLELVWPRW